MGGSGSTRWDGHRKRLPVEACPAVSIRDLKAAGALRALPPDWDSQGGTSVPEGWDGRVCWPGRDWPLVLLPDGFRAGVEEWRPSLGGSSWWFHCPSCDRRCRKMYRPPGARWYFCRQCHGLTYLSAQEAHRWDRGAQIGILCALAGITPREFERQMRADFKAERQANRGTL